MKKILLSFCAIAVIATSCSSPTTDTAAAKHAEAGAISRVEPTPNTTFNAGENVGDKVSQTTLKQSAEEPEAYRTYNVVPDSIYVTELDVEKITDEDCRGKIEGQQALKISYTLTIVWHDPHGELKHHVNTMKSWDCAQGDDDNGIQVGGYTLNNILKFIESNQDEKKYTAYIIEKNLVMLRFGSTNEKPSGRPKVSKKLNPYVVYMPTDESVVETITGIGFKNFKLHYTYDGYQLKSIETEEEQ